MMPPITLTDDAKELLKTSAGRQCTATEKRDGTDLGNRT
jgi:hypothetical protein